MCAWFKKIHQSMTDSRRCRCDQYSLATYCNQFLLFITLIMSRIYQPHQSFASYMSYFIFQFFFLINGEQTAHVFRKRCVFLKYFIVGLFSWNLHLTFLSISPIFIYIFRQLQYIMITCVLSRTNSLTMLQFTPRDIIYTSIINHQYMTSNIIQYCHVGVTSITKNLFFYTTKKKNNVNFILFITFRYWIWS